MTKINNLLSIKIAFLFVVFCNAVVDVAHKVLLQNIAFKVFDGTTQVIWISIINAMIIIPFLLLFTLSGYLSDKYNKKNIMVYGAVSSFLLSVLMIISYMSENFYFAMFSLVLLAVQSAIYSPAKFGLILDIYGKKNLSRGNAALQAISIIAILFSIGVASFVFENFYNLNNLQSLTSKEELLTAILPLTYYILPVAFLEMVVSFLFLRRINTVYVKDENLSLNKDEFFKGKLLVKNIKTIFSHDVIFLSVIGLSVFWGVSQATMAVFPSFVKQYLNITDVFLINGVIAASGVGIAIGSVLYSRISKHYIEVGTIPLASFGMAFSLYISTVVQTPFLLAITFLMFGVFGGMFVVPLNALIQFNAKKKVLGTILAGNNWFHSLSMFLMLCMTTIVSYFELDPLKTIYLILTIIVIGTAYTIYKLPQSLILLFLKSIVGLKYKLEVDGIKNIPSSGGVLLLGNHISWIDWAIILMAVPREVKFVMDKTIYSKWYITWILKMFKAIPISNISSKSTIQTIAKELDSGSVVVLFPEGSITRNGHLGEFKKGFEKVLELTQTEIKVIPFYIRGLWESMFSRANKKFKKSKRTSNVTVSFARSMNKSRANIVSVKKEVFELSSKSWKEHIRNLKPLNETIFDRLKEVSSEIVFADSTGLELSGNKFLTASILFKDLLKKEIKGQNIGLLVPSTASGAFINYTVLMMGKTAINLNYTSEINSLKSSIELAEIKTIIASKKFVEKLESKAINIKEILELVEVIYLEDIKTKISKNKGLFTYLSVKFLPSCILKLIHLTKTNKDDTVMILFSSGSEGKPKGVELSGDNILGNAQQIANIINVSNEDTIVGSLPLFHAFGIVVTTYLPLIEGIKCVAHPDPTDGLGIAKLVSSYKATIMCGTSTFFRLYAKNQKIHPLMFESLRLVVAGAEKLREDVKFEFKKRFGKDILEGFGATETSPVASCNLPDVLASDFTVQIGQKVGTVGMAIPGTTIKIVNPETFKELESNEEGMILISGIQVMKGYLKNEEKTKQVLKTIRGKTYYITGDKGKIDEDGFITIVDRYSRFAKLGGEMISLGAVEEKISRLLELKDDSSVDFIVTSVEDEKKGEKIVLLISNVDEEYVLKLKEKILNNFENKLMIPSNIKIIDEIPKLGSGKKDFNAAKLKAKD
ncbi:acyl-[ACP]--phospholipid O-acyltransferase [Arcobacter ellisii]|uniref:2-acylglycerophosphoethanolamine acyltransferase / acyl-acyl carrier protein synthetase n=1 Tax=Arcobacter ellisii TaxID=913109 RepID=A0A347U5A0_9BACT|nr:acyl-[ACP]--phospholipid O-acyltransferase [Arcobacter ellisii]AXX94028.1 2-acylglycerophosphoethanolamine acyltransferase / acyl-acyl carrier protein synthetase [Arcobacter ellisii]RXI32388.1 acyl-[ACP]--phospholipid O-acyltransferase [Arcobacter ellisii]